MNEKAAAPSTARISEAELHPTPAVLPTVRVVSDEHPSGSIVINESDFDPDIHSPYVEDNQREASR